MAKKDYYDVLGVSKGSTKQEIKKGYRKMAVKFHPDKNPDDASAEAKFKEAAEAYEILSDDNKKARYDQYGHAGFENGGGGGGFGGFGGGGMDMDDIFSQFGDIFGGGGGSRGGSRQRRVKGSNLRVRITLTLEEIANGVEKKIKVKRKKQAPGTTYKTCTTCNGNGQVMRVTNTILGRMQTAATCPTCSGAGQQIDKKGPGSDSFGLIAEDETVSVKIPAGVVDEMQLKVSGKGNEAPGQGVPGDLLVVIQEEEHKKLKREGDNLHYDLYISFSEAALGVSKEIETVTGNVRIKLDAGIQSGKILRLRGKGIPSINGYGKGDLLVHINIWTPQELNKEQKEFFKAMQDHEHFAPNPRDDEKSFFDKVKDMFS